jgi:hypothetical protein
MSKGVRGRVGGKQLAAVLCLLRAAPRVECQQHFIDDIEVDPIQVPTGIEVARMLLGGDEAAIDVDALAAGVAQIAQRTRQPLQQLPAPRCCTEALDDLEPHGQVLAGRQVSGRRLMGREHDTTLLLCRNQVKRNFAAWRPTCPAGSDNNAGRANAGGTASKAASLAMSQQCVESLRRLRALADQGAPCLCHNARVDPACMTAIEQPAHQGTHGAIGLGRAEPVLASRNTRIAAADQRLALRCE